MLIGLVVGSLAIGASLKGPATVAMAAPLAIWSLPMFDSFVAILRRKLTGRSIYATDRGHLHHRLMARFGKNTRVLGVVALCCAVTCGGALLSMFMQNDFLAIGSVLLVICILVATQIFGHVEFMMLANRMKSVGMSFIRPSMGSGSWQTSTRLQGTREWDMLWQSLIEYAEKSRLIEIRIDLNLAAIQEAYHASWKRRSKCERRELWRAEVPLFVDQHVIGRINLTGEREAGSVVCDVISRVMETLAMLEGEITALASNTNVVSETPGASDAAGSSNAKIADDHATSEVNAEPAVNAVASSS